MICPTCQEGFVIVKMSVHSGCNDPRESYGPGLNVSYTCNVCDKPVRVDTNRYPASLDGLRRIVQKQLNADRGDTLINSEDGNGDPAYGWHG